MKQVLILFSFFFSALLCAQTNCAFAKDTFFIPKENKTINGEFLETVFKNKTIVKLIKSETNKYYLKMIVPENLYFDRVDVLEIRSGTKSFYAKETKQFQLNKHTGFYVVELYKNYVATLKEDGITSIVFNKAETIFTKQDCSQIKQIAKCFYEAVSTKK